MLKQIIKSALYITGDKASKHFAVLTPYIDFETIINQREAFKNNLKHRQSTINLETVIKNWQFYQDLNEKRHKLEQNRLQIGAHLSKLLKEGSEDSEIEKWRVQSKLIKDEIKNMKDMYYSVDEDIHLQILSLPNSLHNNCPVDHPILLHKNMEKPLKQSENHLVVGRQLINYINPYSCYLMGDAALFELSITNYLRKLFKEQNFTQFSSPDFSRSIVVEGCAKTLHEVFTLQEQNDKQDIINRLHLTGGAALEAYMAYFTKHFVLSNAFPLLYFSMGRKYQPYNPNLPLDLFNLCQESAFNIFVAYLEDEDKLLDKLKFLLINFYDSLGYHYKIELETAKNLQNSESLRFSVKMYSGNLQDYVEVANLSLYDDFLSKRLLFTTNVDKQRVFPKIIHGTLLNVQKFLGCAIENNNSALLSDLLKKHMFI